MKIACVGGGPAGLYFAISMKLRNPAVQVDVFERNKSGDTFGWGVVFSDQTMENLRRNDPVSACTMEAELTHWDDIDVHVGGAKVSSTGHGFIGIGSVFSTSCRIARLISGSNKSSNTRSIQICQLSMTTT